MGRTRSFEQAVTVRRASEAFLATGYEGTSIDDLVRATGLHRGSLYQAFGSKRGIFLTALRQVLADGVESSSALDLLLVATLELAPRDDEIRAVVAVALNSFTQPAQVLGARLLERADLELERDINVKEQT